MKRASLATLVLLIGCSVASLAGCSHELDPGMGADFVAPEDDGSNIDEQGLYSCTERTDTGYRNGNAFSIKVVTVDGKPVEVKTANKYILMQEAARRDGVSVRIVSGFRTMAEQRYLYGCYVNCNCNSCNLAATPGYSNHQSGHALDLNTSDGRVLSWLNNNGRRFGFERTVPSESWHWEWWSGGPDGGPCGHGDIPRPCTSGDFDGEFCDDDRSGNEAAHDRLKEELGVNFNCTDLAGEPAFCPRKEVTRAQVVWVLGKAFGMPLANHDNAFRDDNGHKYEAYLNAAQDYGVLLGNADERRVNPDGKITRSGLALVLKRMFVLPPADRDYFDDDDNNAHEDVHNRVAAAGLMKGQDDGAGERGDFKPAVKVNKSSLAAITLRAFDKGLIPKWDIPTQCLENSFAGAFCDDDGSGAEGDHDRLVGELQTPFSCGELAGAPAFCGAREATRSQMIYVLLRAAGVPTDGHPNAFRDDNGHGNEEYFDAAHAYGIVNGYNNGTEMRPGLIANRDALSIVLAKMYALPDPGVDYFSDDDGTNMEIWHNKVAAVGLFGGYDDGNGGRAFRGADKANRNMLATLAVRAKDAALVPVWSQ